MTIWILFALMTAAAVMAVLWPLSRRPADGAVAETETAFYRDQMSEIDRDLARGLISETEAEGARAEAGRRLLRAGTAAGPRTDGVGEPALRRRRAASAVALSLVPLLALAVYGAWGSPQIPAQPLAARLQADPGALDLAQAVSRIETHLAAQPGDGRGWEVLAPVYMRAGRYDEAAKAFRAAIDILGETPARLIGYGEALSSAASGIVPADARIAFERVLVLEPGMPRAVFHLARADEQDGNVEAARSRYAEILARSPADAPWLPLVKERLSALPGGAGAAAVAALPAADRDAAIRTMVESLAQRLETQGGTGDEWLRLVRARTVLGEADKARAALAQARKALEADPAETAKLEAAARDLSTDAPR